jgi:hypothetical protein
LEQHFIRLVKIGDHNRGRGAINEGFPTLFPFLDEIINFLYSLRLFDIADLLGSLFEVILTDLNFRDVILAGKGNISVKTKIPDST